VTILTRHESLTDISILAIESRKHVFVEKPVAINSKDFELLFQALYKKRLTKFHVGYKHEWRFKKEIAGGGELIDQGSYLIELCLIFLGQVSVKCAATSNYFWKSPVADNAFIVVKNGRGAIGFVHASCTEWKNMFSLELYFEKYKLDISGLGEYVGSEISTIQKISTEMGPPESVKMELENSDNSWALKFQTFLNDIIQDSNRSYNVEASKKVLEIIPEIYERLGR
jgi:predicted dehydrogenase